MDKHLLDINVSHPIQVSVMETLRHKEQISYSSLSPDGMSGNEFGYHLNKLTKAGLIIKNVDFYMLTPLGLLVADSASYDSNKLKLRPVVGCWLYVTNTNAQLLHYYSKRAPLFDKVCLPFGKLRIGESVETTVHRMLAKRGFEPSSVVIVNRYLANVRYVLESEIVAHRFGEVIVAEFKGIDSPKVSTKNGDSYFADQSLPYLENAFDSNNTVDYEVTVVKS